MIIRTKLLALVTVLTFVVGIGLTMAFNLWVSSPIKVPAKYTQGEFAGTSNPADIRGSYTFADIAKSFPVEVSVLAKAFGIPNDASTADFQVKDLETLNSDREGPEIGTDSVRLFVARYCGLPFEAKEEVGLLPEALQILGDRASPASVTAPAVATPEPPPVAATNPKPASTTPAPTVKTEATITEPKGSGEGTGTSVEKAVKGGTTFGNLLEWGLSPSEVEGLLGGLGKTEETVRGWLSDQGKEFSEYRTKLQDLLDRKP